MPDRKRNWDKTPEAQAYRNQYTREHYDQIQITVPKGFRETIDQAAKQEDLNRSQFIVKLVREHIEKGTE